MPTVLKYGSLNLLEPSGPVQACNGIALPFTLSSIFYTQSNSNALPVSLLTSVRLITHNLVYNLQRIGLLFDDIASRTVNITIHISNSRQWMKQKEDGKSESSVVPVLLYYALRCKKYGRIQ